MTNNEIDGKKHSTFLTRNIPVRAYDVVKRIARSIKKKSKDGGEFFLSFFVTSSSRSQMRNKKNKKKGKIGKKKEKKKEKNIYEVPYVFNENQLQKKKKELKWKSTKKN